MLDLVVSNLSSAEAKDFLEFQELSEVKGECRTGRILGPPFIPFLSGLIRVFWLLPLC